MFSGEERELSREVEFTEGGHDFLSLPKRFWWAQDRDCIYCFMHWTWEKVRTAFNAQDSSIKCCTVCTDFKGTAWSTAFINYSTEIEGLNSLFLARISREYDLYLLQYGLHLLLARKSRQYGAFNSAGTIFWVVRSAFNELYGMHLMHRNRGVRTVQFSRYGLHSFRG